MIEQLTLKNWMAVGDNLVFTAAIRELHLQYPNKYQTAVLSLYPEVFYNNPFVAELNTAWPVIDLQYADQIKTARSTGDHFTASFIHEINRQLNINLKVCGMRPDIFLTEQEKSDEILNRLGIEKPYWIFNSGFKNDMPLKAYPPSSWGAVLRKLKEKGINIIQTGHSHHIHPTFRDVQSVVGKTDNLRDYFSLMYHAQGSIGAVSLQMHVAAALNKPCVVLAGGREDVRWEMYQDHHFIHSVGFLDCCKSGGCWKKKREECLNMGTFFPKCMEMINPDEIVNAVLKYEGLYDV